MATPTEHAVCSASASERWLHCTAAPRLEQTIAEDTTSYAEEGRLAHEFCELAGRLKFGEITKRKYTTAVNKLKKDPLFSEEMLTTSAIYADYLYEKSMEYDEKPFIAFEVHSDFGTYVPEGFGTSDCVMVGVKNGERVLRVFDYKHGKGVAVSSEDNSQMKLYALGVLETYKLVYGDSITKVITAIIQPRLFKDVVEYEIPVSELKAWGESIKPTAQKAFYGFGASYAPGDWCRFCRAKTLCRARSDMYSGFVEIKNEYALSGEENEENKPLLSDSDVGQILTSAQGIVEWYKSLTDYAVSRLLAGGIIPGWKVVAGRSVRSFSDIDAAMNAVMQAGYMRDQLYTYEPKSLSALEKMIGAKAFDEIAGKYIVKPLGKPTLVVEADKRPAYNSVQADYEGIRQEMMQNQETAV